MAPRDEIVGCSAHKRGELNVSWSPTRNDPRGHKASKWYTKRYMNNGILMTAWFLLLVATATLVYLLRDQPMLQEARELLRYVSVI